MVPNYFLAPIMEFQFLLGTLKTHLPELKIKEIIEFQFLLGTLKTGRTVPQPYAHQGFNSF